MEKVIANLSVRSKTELESRLNAAIDAATAAADYRHGVLVTRHSYSRFTVVLTPAVPFGQIRENDQLMRP